MMHHVADRPAQICVVDVYPYDNPCGPITFMVCDGRITEGEILYREPPFCDEPLRKWWSGRRGPNGKRAVMRWFLRRMKSWRASVADGKRLDRE